MLRRLRQGYPPIQELDPQWSQRLVRRPPSPRRMAGVWLRRAADRTQAEHQALERFLELCPEARLAFSLTERFKMQFRADAFNLFNNVNFGPPHDHHQRPGCRRCFDRRRSADPTVGLEAFLLSEAFLSYDPQSAKLFSYFV